MRTRTGRCKKKTHAYMRLKYMVKSAADICLQRVRKETARLITATSSRA